MPTLCTVHKLIADLAVFAHDRVLLVKYKDVTRYDGQRGWFLPDDFLHHEEHPEDAAKRIGREQAGLEVPAPRLSHIESFGNGAWHLTFHYRTELKRASSIAPGGNVAEAEWFDVRRLPGAESVAHQGWALEVVKAMRRADR